MVQWICELTKYIIVIRHILGSTNTAANAISCQDHNNFIPTGNDPVSIFSIHDSSYHTKQLYPIEASGIFN